MKEIIYSSFAPEPIGAYSQAVKIDGMVYVSGQIPLDKITGQLITEDIKKETTQVMKNIEHILHAAHTSFDHVIKCSIFMTNMNHFSAINEVYAKCFKENPPARETVEVSQLPKGVNVEISCIAYCD